MTCFHEIHRSRNPQDAVIEDEGVGASDFSFSYLSPLLSPIFLPLSSPRHLFPSQPPASHPPYYHPTITLLLLTLTSSQLTSHLRPSFTSPGAKVLFLCCFSLLDADLRTTRRTVRFGGEVCDFFSFSLFYSSFSFSPSLPISLFFSSFSLFPFSFSSYVDMVQILFLACGNVIFLR